MIRGQFLIGILFPLIISTQIAILNSKSFHLVNFILVLGEGLGLHIATNVYNDIYDTLQGADKKDENTRNYYSGGSGLILQNPKLMSRMFLLARLGIVISFASMILLLTQVEYNLWLIIIIVYLITAFLSKYYTAAPVKLGYRGVGEFFVWLGFGPLAIAMGVLSQNLPINTYYVQFMPLTGFTTLTILWFGQFMDLDSDQAAGKCGLVAHLGTNLARYGYLIIHACIILNVIWISLIIPRIWWLSVVVIILYIALFPRLWKTLLKYHSNPERLLNVSGLNVALYASVSIICILTLGVALIL